MHFLFSRIVIYSYTFFIFVFSVLPVSGPAGVPFLDKITHFLIYALLSFMVANRMLLRKENHVSQIAFFYAFIVGLCIEIVQIFIPYRSFQIGDIISNSLGGFAGMLLRIV